MNLEKNYLIKEENSILIVLCMYLFYPSVQEIIWKITYMITGIIGIEPSRTVLNSIIWLIATFPMIKFSFRYIRIKDFFFFIILEAICAISFANTTYAGFAMNQWLTLSFCIVPAFLFGIRIKNFEGLLERLYYPAVISFAVTIVYQFLYANIQSSITNYFMNVSYKVLPAVLIIISNVLWKKRSILRIFLCICAVGFVISLGARGPILCILALVIFSYIKKVGLKKVTIIISLLVLVLFYVLSSKTTLDFINRQLSSVFGIDSRVIQMLSSGELLKSDGRDSLSEAVFTEIVENPFAIRGLYADRIATAGISNYEVYLFIDEMGVYVHNLVLELVLDFGIVIGGGFVIWLVIQILNKFIKSPDENFWIFAVFVSVTVVKLMVSSSFIIEKNFFFLIGMLVNPYLTEGFFCKDQNE